MFYQRFFVASVLAFAMAFSGLHAQTQLQFDSGFTTLDEGGIAYLRASGNLAIINQQGSGGGGLTRIDIYTPTGTLVNIVQLSTAGLAAGEGFLDDGLADLPNGNLVVLTTFGNVVEVDPLSGTVVPGGYGGFNVLNGLGTGAETSGFGINPSTLDLWVLNDNGNPFDTLTQFDSIGNVVSGPVFALPGNLNGDAEAVSFLPGLETMLVAEDNTNSLMEITPTGQLVQSFNVALLSQGSGQFVDPNGIAVDFETNRLFVANKGDNIGNIMVFSIVTPLLLGDVNCDGFVDLLDVRPFVDLLASGVFMGKADMNQDENLDLLDVSPFVNALADN